MAPNSNYSTHVAHAHTKCPSAHLSCNQYESFYHSRNKNEKIIRANSVRKQLKDLGKLLNIDLCPVFTSLKVGEDLKHKEIKPALINEQSIVYKFECGWCDASYVGYTRWYLQGISTNESMSIKDLDQYSITANSTSIKNNNI